MSIYFTVVGEPRPQPRPRAFTRKMGDEVVARVYDGHSAEGWKSLIAIAAKPHRLKQPLLGPVLLNAIFIFPRPNTHFVASKRDRPLRAIAPHWHTNKPDRDNLEKALLDALKTIGGFFHDDCQVCAGEVQKIYGPTPGVIVEIEALDEPIAKEGVAA